VNGSANACVCGSVVRVVVPVVTADVIVMGDGVAARTILPKDDNLQPRFRDCVPINDDDEDDLLGVVVLWLLLWLLLLLLFLSPVNEDELPPWC
jgi:hypothetical protein